VWVSEGSRKLQASRSDWRVAFDEPRLAGKTGSAYKSVSSAKKLLLHLLKVIFFNTLFFVSVTLKTPRKSLRVDLHKSMRM